MLAKILSLFKRPTALSPEPASPGAAPPAPAAGTAQAIDHYRSANRLKDSGRLEEALAGYDRAIALEPDLAVAFCNRGFVLERLNRLEAAGDSYARAVALDPEDALAWHNRAAVLGRLGRPTEALDSYERAISLKPEYAEAYCNRGVLLMELERWEPALDGFDRSIALYPDSFQAHFNRGTLLHKRRRPDAALASYDRAIELSPASVEAHRYRGVLLTELGEWEAARLSLERARSLRPDDAETHFGLGNLLLGVGRLDAALAEFDRAIALKPGYTDAHYNRADTLAQMTRYQAAVADYDIVLSLDPAFRLALGMRRYAKMQVCDWQGFDADVERLRSGIEAGEAVSPPFPVVALLDSADLQHKAAQLWVTDWILKDPLLADPLPAAPRRAPGGRIRVGYFSSDFREHPVSRLVAELIETHDRARFEVSGFAWGPPSGDELRGRLERGFERFFDVQGRSNREIAELARSLPLDIAVDLGGHTQGSRPGIFALRAAPLQINYLGYPATSGAPYLDYLIADRVLIPAAQQQHYSEKVLYLPSFQANDSKRRIAERRFSRAELGLPASGVVFCCFNTSYKLTPDTMDSWMRILARVPGSSLLLYAADAAVAENLRREAQSRGIAPQRLCFAGKLPSPEYLARYRAADVFLDTLPYNGGTVVSDALWAGLPVLTRAGTAFAGRMAASLLHSVGLEELIATSAAQYEELAVALAHDPARRAAIGESLRQRRAAGTLFDPRRFTRHLESGYEAILARHLAGQPPAHLDVSPLPT